MGIPRITPEDTLLEAAQKLAGKHTGALRALGAIMTSVKTVDPSSPTGAVGPMIALDTMGIHDGDIANYFAGVCGSDVVVAICLLRAQQLSLVHSDVILAALHEGCRLPVHLEASIMARLREQVPDFAGGRRPREARPTTPTEIEARRAAAIEARLVKIVAEQLGIEEAGVTRDKAFEQNLGCDSLDLVEIVMAVEDEFEVEIPDEDCEPLKTVGQAIDYVVGRREARA